MGIKYRIKHRMPGRIRLQVPALGYLPYSEIACRQLFSKQNEVTNVRVNLYVSSLVIDYDASSNDFPKKLLKIFGSITLAKLESLATQAKELEAKQAATNGNSANGKDQENVQENDSIFSAVEDFSVRYPLALPTASLALSLIGGAAGALVTVPLIAYNAAPTIKRALEVLQNEQRLNVDFLDGLAITISTLQGSFFTSSFINWLLGLGDFIRDKTGSKSKRAIENLLDYQNQMAWVLRGDEKVEIKVSEIETGETVIAYAGEMIPVDGEVLDGDASVDQKTITGESLPVRRGKGDKVFAATVVREGKLYLRADRTGDQTTAAQIVRMVESAPVGETRIQNYAEKFADKLVAPSLAGATGLYAMSGDLNRFLSMIIIDYGTGIRVAAPTTVLASMINAAHQGILIKGGRQLEKLSQVDTIVFDKTGTLTEGNPRVTDIKSFDEKHFPVNEILALAAAAEARLTHPVALAILNKAQELNLKIPERDESKYHIGLGVEVQINGYYVHLGSERFMRENNIKIDGASSDLRNLNNHGYSSLALAVNGELKGLISYADQIRLESSAVIKTLHNRGMKNLIMLTGDNKTVAERVSNQLGLDGYFAEVFPEEKAKIVRRLQSKGHVVAMVGDGINDSPALAYADVGISMKSGADIAREAADVVLMEENLWKIINVLDVSNEAMHLINQNFAIIAGLNTLAYALAIPGGLVSPALTTVISNGSAILASLNAIRPILKY